MHQPTFLMFKHPASLTNSSWRESPPVGKRVPVKADHAQPPHPHPHPPTHAHVVNHWCHIRLCIQVCQSGGFGVDVASSARYSCSRLSDSRGSDCQTSLTAESRRRIRRGGPDRLPALTIPSIATSAPDFPRARFQLTRVAPSPLSWLKTAS